MLTLRPAYYADATSPRKLAGRRVKRRPVSFQN
jgi:hypothetical protein